MYCRQSLHRDDAGIGGFGPHHRSADVCVSLLRTALDNALAELAAARVVVAECRKLSAAYDERTTRGANMLALAAEARRTRQSLTHRIDNTPHAFDIGDVCSDILDALAAYDAPLWEGAVDPSPRKRKAKRAPKAKGST
jgi:hypothetical protein